jgi:hypothetical protein
MVKDETSLDVGEADGSMAPKGDRLILNMTAIPVQKVGPNIYNVERSS